MAGNDDIGIYTNFLILDMFQRRLGKEGAVERLIDRDRVEKSLLLQYGLGPDRAKTRCGVQDRAVFRSVSDPSHRRTIW